jgi:redox-sensing transcriptional repressor
MASEAAVAQRGREGQRLTVGVAARLSQYLRVLTQAKKMGQQRIADHGFNIAAAFDVDDGKIGMPIGHVTVSDYRRLRETIRDKNIIVAVLAVPPEAAQQVADDVVRAGVKIIFNYTEALLHVPGDVTVHTTSPAVELLYALYFYLT